MGLKCRLLGHKPECKEFRKKTICVCERCGETVEYEKHELKRK